MSIPAFILICLALVVIVPTVLLRAYAQGAIAAVGLVWCIVIGRLVFGDTATWLWLTDVSGAAWLIAWRSALRKTAPKTPKSAR